jgi:hypothetical protein
MSRRRIRLLLVLVPALCVPAVVASAEEPAKANGVVIYRDPATGRLSAPPPGLAPRAQGAPVQAGSVVETRGTTPAGGWKASGPFRHTMQATLGPGGVAVECVPNSSEETR